MMLNSIRPVNTYRILSIIIGSVIANAGIRCMHFRLYILSLACFFVLFSAQAKYYPIPFILHEQEMQQRFRGAKVVMELTGPWAGESGLIRNVPFWETEKKNLVLRRHFKLPDTVSNVSIYFEGVAWTSEIYLNGRLLTIHRNPFESILIPLDAQWLSPVQNELVVHMTTEGDETEWKHLHALGIHRPVWILSDGSELPKAAKRYAHNPLDSFIVYNPLSSGFLYHIPQDRLKTDIQFLSAQKVRAVFFPVTPDWEVLSAFDKAGFFRISKVPEKGLGLWFYAWPTEKGKYLNTHIFWFNDILQPTDAISSWHSLDDLYICMRKYDNFVILLIMMFPLLGLLILKLSHGQVFNSILQWVFRERLEKELIADRKFLRSGQSALMTLNHLLLMAASIALLIYFFQVMCFDSLYFTVSGKESPIHRLMHAGFHPVVQFLIVFSILSLVLFVKLIFLSFISLVFRKHFISGVYLDLQILAGFPLNMILLAFSVYIFYSFDIQSDILLNVWLGILLLLFFRHIWLLFKGMYTMYHFHPLLIFLYICAFEILPWLFVLDS
jgi:hypothetical protein